MPLRGTAAPHETGVCVGHTPLWHETAGIAWALGGEPLQDAGAPQGVPFATGVLHTPPTHVSTVHVFPSFVHAKPSGWFVCTQPVDVLQESAVQGFESAQFTAPPPCQTPLTQPSLLVHALSSVHETADRGEATQVFVPSLQVPVLHWSVNAEQSRAPPPVHTPA